MSLNRLHPLKIVITGDTPVGKTSILNRIVGEPFSMATQATINFSYLKSSITIDGVEVASLIYDTTGMDKFCNMLRIFISNSDGCILVYDVTDKKSFENVKKWMQYFVDANNIRQEQFSIPSPWKQV